MVEVNIMDKESLIQLIEKTRNNIKEFETKIFNENKNDYAIYRAETSIYLDNLKFIEKLLDYSLNAEEIDAIKENLDEMNGIIEKDLVKTNEDTNTYNTVNDFNSINFDTIAQEVNNTTDNYPSVEQFIAN